MTKVFMPLNRRMMETVITHPDLLYDDTADNMMPAPLLDLCAHVAGYEITLSRWQEHDFEPTAADDNVSVIDFPQKTLTPYVSRAYKALRAEQSDLLSSLQPRSSSQSGPKRRTAATLGGRLAR